MGYQVLSDDLQSGDYPKSGRKFHVEGETYKWVPYDKSVRHVYGQGRFQRMAWKGDWFRWVNDDPPAGKPFSLYVRVTQEEYEARQAKRGAGL